jgi:hypothetical protein
MNDLRILRSLSQAGNDVFIWQIVIDHEKQARSANLDNFWMGQAPETVSVTYSRWIGTRPPFCGAESMGVCFPVPPGPIAPSCSKISEEANIELV